jgi:hypothetical protein
VTLRVTLKWHFDFGSRILDRRSLIEERGVKTTVIAVIAVMPRRKGLIFAAKGEGGKQHGDNGVGGAGRATAAAPQRVPVGRRACACARPGQGRAPPLRLGMNSSGGSSQRFSW